jgi:thioredoxin reductase
MQRLSRQETRDFGGGDSALDWVIDFAGKAAAITHVHRRTQFKAAPASVAKMRRWLTPVRSGT